MDSDWVFMLLAFGAVIAAVLSATVFTLWVFGIHP